MPRHKKISHCEAKSLLKSEGVDFSQDFYTLRMSDQTRIAEVARMAGYRKRRDAPGSTSRMYFQLLGRTRAC